MNHHRCAVKENCDLILTLKESGHRIAAVLACLGVVYLVGCEVLHSYDRSLQRFAFTIENPPVNGTPTNLRVQGRTKKQRGCEGQPPSYQLHGYLTLSEGFSAWWTETEIYTERNENTTWLSEEVCLSPGVCLGQPRYPRL